MTIDYADLAARQAAGEPYGQLAAEVGLSSGKILRDRLNRWRQRSGASGSVSETPSKESRTKSMLARLPVKVTNLDELIAALQVDMETWRVRGFTGNAWQGQTAEGVETFLQVKAQFERDKAQELEAALEAIGQATEEMKVHSVEYAKLDRTKNSPLLGDPVLYSIHINEPHLGMLAWGPEVGTDYDIRIARSDYVKAADALCNLAWLYPVERVLVVIGNDMAHVDMVGLSRRGGTTTAGTPQDMDGRLTKQFSTCRKVAVHLIDRARQIAPVDVEVVPGNHDRETMFKLGEVLAAWYRNDTEVTVKNSPAKRSFYGYGQNAFMLTHGEEYRRHRDSLPLIFATECPGDLWVNARYREILTGHNHVNLAGRYWPTSDQTETRGIRTRSLPGLTPEDAWHTEEGYRHVRSATSIAYRKSGGVVGLHEFNLFNEETK